MKRILYICSCVTLIVGCSSVKPTPVILPPPPPVPQSSQFIRAAMMPTPAFVTTNVPTATVLWNAVAPSFGIKGYKLYYGPTSRNYINTTDVGNVLSKQITNLVRGATYFFAVSDYTTNIPALESDFSSEVSYTVPNIPPPPGGVSLTVDIVSAKTIEGPWTPLTNMVATISDTNDFSFFKGTLTVKTLP